MAASPEATTTSPLQPPSVLCNAPKVVVKIKFWFLRSIFLVF